MDGFVALDDEGVDDDGDAMSADYSVHSYFEQSRYLMMFCPVFYKYKYPLDFNDAMESSQQFEKTRTYMNWLVCVD